MSILHILSPILLLVLLGFVLARIQFLGTLFISELNRLAFWVALPALLFRSVAHAERPGPQTLDLLETMLVATLLAAILGWLAAMALRLPAASRGTLSQSAFRGNLAYIAIPVLSYALEGRENGSQAFATAVIVMTVLMGFFNILAVVVLQVSRHELSLPVLVKSLKAIATNPLLIAGIAGLPLGLTGTRIPLFLDRTLEALGGAAVPIALLCIGGSLAHARLEGRLPAIATAALIKTAVLPLIVWFLAPIFQLHEAELRIALVMAACPTAAAAFVMVRQMGGDDSLAGGSIVLSTLLSALSLPVVLWLSH